VNSNLEAIERLIPMIIFPLYTLDQTFFCKQVHDTHIGRCTYKRHLTSESVLEDIKNIEEGRFFREALMKQKAILGHKRKEGMGIGEWVDYYFEVGTDHLKSRQYERMGGIQRLELDIIIPGFAIALLLCWTLWKVIKKYLFK